MALDGTDKRVPYEKVFLTGGRFDCLLLESIDEAFSTLGDSPKTAIYYHLEQKFDLSREVIPQKIEEFTDALEKVFGLGATHLEILIMKNLRRKTASNRGIPPAAWNAASLTFSAYIVLQRQLFERSQKTL